MDKKKKGKKNQRLHYAPTAAAAAAAEPQIDLDEAKGQPQRNETDYEELTRYLQSMGLDISGRTPPPPSVGTMGLKLDKDNENEINSLQETENGYRFVYGDYEVDVNVRRTDTSKKEKERDKEPHEK